MSDGVEGQKLNLPLLISKETCAGKTYIVTGANSGLGFEAAKHLTSMAPEKVILAVRNPESGAKAKADIEAATGTSGIAEIWELDLSSYDSVKAFAKKAGTLPRIDAVIENAAIANSARTLAEGHLASVTVNVLSTMLLGVLLLPKLTETARKLNVTPTLAFVGSRVGFTVQGAWDEIKDDPIARMDDESFIGMKSYPVSKLFEAFVVRYFAQHIAPLDKTGVVVNLVCPGLCVTALDRNVAPPFKNQLAELRAKHGRTAEDGSRTLLHAVVAGRESHGHLLHSCEDGEDVVPDFVNQDKAAQKRAWEVVEQELETVQRGCIAQILK